MDLPERYQQRCEAILAQIKEQLEQIPEGPEKETLEKALEELKQAVRNH